MLPQTKMATSTEVEGDTTVDVTGFMADGKSLQDAQEAEDQENKTADSQDEESESEEQDAQPEPKKESEPEPSEKAEPSRKERRMEKLIDKLKERTDEASELRRQLQTIKSPLDSTQEAESATQLPPWMQPSQDAPSEITPEQYKQDVVSTAHGLVKAELGEYQKRVERYENYNDDLRYVESKYPQLNQDNVEAYNAEQAKTVAELYAKASQADPKLRLKNFVESIMSFHQAGQEEGKKDVTEKTLQRESEMAVTPSQNGATKASKEVDWDSMSLKEKEEWMKANGIWDF